MRTLLTCLLGAALAALIAPPQSSEAQDLPPAAREMVESAKRDTDAWESIRSKAEDEIKARKSRLAKQLNDQIQQLRAQGQNAEAEQIVRYVAGQDTPAAESAKIEVLWNGHWYPATVVKREGNRTLIKYDGYSDQWNEWVGAERIRGLNAKPDGGLVVGGAVEVLWGGRWWPGKLLRFENNLYHISYDEYGPEWNESVGADRIRPLQSPAAGNRFAVGASVDIEWHGTWYPGQVLKSEDNRWFIAYDGYGEHWHEWVGPDRIRAREQGEKKAVLEAGSKVDIEWHGSWYPGEILKVENGRYYIHYDNHTDTWNEWVGADRLRGRTAPAYPFPIPTGLELPDDYLLHGGGYPVLRYSKGAKK